MKSDKPKVMHEILGYPLVYFPLTAARELSETVLAVVGHAREQVEPYLHTHSVQTVLQDQPQGTGHAVAQTLPVLASLTERDVLIIPGDMPLITRESLSALVERCRSEEATMGILTATLENPFGYGRIVRDGDGLVTGIVEEADATEQQKSIREVNTGVYLINKEFLLDAVGRLTPDNAKGEFYLTDIVALAPRAVSHAVNDSVEANGINSRVQLAEAATLMQQRINRRVMENGVTLHDPATTWISPDAVISRDVEIWPGTHVLGRSRLDEGCRIMAHCCITDSIVGRDSLVEQGAILTRANVTPDTRLAPYTCLQQD